MTLGDEGDCELQYQADIDGFAFELPLGECGMALSRSRLKIKKTFLESKNFIFLNLIKGKQDQ